METINSFDIILALIKAHKDENTFHTVPGPDNYDVKLDSVHYLLGQTIRNLWNKKGHICISKKALEKWNELKVGEPIINYSYQKPVYYKNEEPVYIKCYKGASSSPYYGGEVKYVGNSSYFRFRQVFHIEHIVPIGVILEELLKVDINLDKEVLYKELNFILDKIYVCFMLKEEDKELNKVNKIKRSDNYLEVINSDYKKAGIEIVKWY